MAMTDDELEALYDAPEQDDDWDQDHRVGLRAVFEAGRREGAETALTYLEAEDPNGATFNYDTVRRELGIRTLPTESGTTK